jgi:hypothetical protein
LLLLDHLLLLLAEFLQELFWGLDAWGLLGSLDGLGGILGFGLVLGLVLILVVSVFVGGSVAVVGGFFGGCVLLLDLLLDRESGRDLHGLLERLRRLLLGRVGLACAALAAWS